MYDDSVAFPCMIPTKRGCCKLNAHLPIPFYYSNFDNPHKRKLVIHKKVIETSKNIKSEFFSGPTPTNYHYTCIPPS